jgi:hypothetical protein
VEACSILLDLLFRYKVVIGTTTLLVFIRGIFKQVPIRGDKKLFGFLQSTTAVANVSFGEDEIGWEELDGILQEDLLWWLDSAGHCIIDESAGIIDLPGDDKSLSLIYCFGNLHFLLYIKVLVNRDKIYLHRALFSIVFCWLLPRRMDQRFLPHPLD